MDQKYLLIFGIILMFGVILISGCIQKSETQEKPLFNETTPITNRTKEHKDYFNVYSIDFDPSMAGNPNPKVLIGKTPCCEGPYYHSIWRAYSKDGLNWNKEERMFLDHASVPEVLVKEDGTQIVYYVNGSIDTFDCVIVKDGSSNYGDCRIYNFSEEKAWDPEVVKITENVYRLYYVSPGNVHQIRTAVSRDGINWLERGVVLEWRGLIDPTVIKTNLGWRMIVRSEEGLITAISSDVLSFKKEAILYELGNAMTPHLTKLDDKYALYYCKDGIYVSFSQDGRKWGDEKKILEPVQGSIICDPSVERLPNGEFIMYYKLQSMQ
jgi:hypothetical protein